MSSVTCPLSIVILSKGMSGLLDVCLREVEAACDVLPFSPTVVVVDNASPVPLQVNELNCPVEYIRLDRPHSFAEANHVAVSRVPAERILLLNNDVFLHPRALPPMMDALSLPRVGIVGTRLVFPDGTIQHAGVTFGEHPDGGGGHSHYQKPQEHAPGILTYPQAVTGACLLTRQETWQELGGLDGAYDFGGEDVDYCLRARQNGWKVACCPGPASLHLESSTPGRIERDVPSRRHFLNTWKSKVTHDS